MTNPRLGGKWNPPLTPGWFLPTDLPSFLAILQRTPTAGDTDAVRLRRFLKTPQAKWMPDDLRAAIDGYLART